MEKAARCWNRAALERGDMSGKNRTGAVYDRIILGFWVAAGGMLLFTICSVIVDVLLRVAIRTVSLPWVVEVNEYVLFGITFFASAWCLRIRGHIKIDFIFNRFSRKTQTLLNTGTAAFASLACLVFSYYGGFAGWYSFQRGTHLFKFLKVPKYCFATVICICSLLLAIEFMRQARMSFTMWQAMREAEKQARMSGNGQ
jgi:TRAP-type mannitol/chloroaromatic compound transport system permease small subunit